MEVRILKPQEKFDARLIAALAFHQRMSDPEKARQDSEKDPVEDWGAFDEDGRLMAHILHHRFSFRLDGQWIPGGGIGAVSTLPEYRNRGAVRAIFGELLRQAYREGQVLSALYPFNHAFYRKFGYETVRWRDEYCFPPAMLREYRFTGRAVQWKPGDPVGEYTALYEKFASGFNLAVRRDDRKMLEGLRALDLVRGDLDEMVSEGIAGLFMPHGLGHNMGLDVHDMEDLGENLVGYDPDQTRARQLGLGSLRMARRLRPGHVITDEPGIYFIPALIDKWKAEGTGKGFVNYDKLQSYYDFGGIRLEDDVLVTETGARRLGPSRLPIAPDDVEAAMAR